MCSDDFSGIYFLVKMRCVKRFFLLHQPAVKVLMISTLHACSPSFFLKKPESYYKINKLLLYFTLKDYLKWHVQERFTFPSRFQWVSSVSSFSSQCRGKVEDLVKSWPVGCGGGDGWPHRWECLSCCLSLGCWTTMVGVWLVEAMAEGMSIIWWQTSIWNAHSGQSLTLSQLLTQ